MIVVNGSKEVPVIFTAHHAGHDFGQFESRVALTEVQKIRFSDYGTDKTVPNNGITVIISKYSRALGDLNRDPNDHDRFQNQDYGKPKRNNIWKPGQELSDVNKLFCQKNFYEPFHLEIVNQLRKRAKPTFVVAWDNTAHYEIGKNKSGNPVTMKPIILSNRGSEESADSNGEELTSCDPELLMLLANKLEAELKKRGLPSEIHLNLVMRGGYICRTYSSARNKELLQNLGVNCDVQSLQVEYDTIITHNQTTLEPNLENIELLRDAFTEAFKNVFSEYSN